MFADTVSNHFVAAVGFEKLVGKVAEQHWQQFYYERLMTYQKEARHARGALLRGNPMDYHGVRALDRELDEISDCLRALQLEQSSK